MGKEKLLVWPVIITCGVVILLNYLYRWPLYYKGIQIIQSMQADENVVFDWFFLMVTMVIDPTVVFGLCMLMMVLSHKKGQGFIMLIFILLNTFCAAVLKAYDCDPRPIWTQANIRNIGFYCPVQYGNPSGHSWFSAVFGFGILLDYWGSGPYYIFIWISIASVILMPISRMYLGAHSLNQVLQGLCLGLAMCLLYVIQLRSLIKRYLKQFNKDNNWKIVIIVCHVIYWIPFIAHRKQQMPLQWQKNIMDKCNIVMNEGKLNSLMFVVNALLVNVATGIGIGYESLSKSKMGENYLIGKWQINQQKYQLSRGYIYFVVVECACLLSGLVIGAIIYLLVPHIVVAYLALSLGGLVSGYVYTVKTCHLLQKWKIIVQTQP